MSDDQTILETISRKLSILIALQLQTISGDAVQESVAKLDRFGLSVGEIAEILGTTPGTISVAKSRIKKRKR